MRSSVRDNRTPTASVQAARMYSCMPRYLTSLLRLVKALRNKEGITREIARAPPVLRVCGNGCINKGLMKSWIRKVSWR